MKRYLVDAGTGSSDGSARFAYLRTVSFGQEAKPAVPGHHDESAYERGYNRRSDFSNYLVDLGVPTTRLRIVSFGEAKPAVPTTRLPGATTGARTSATSRRILRIRLRRCARSHSGIVLIAARWPAAKAFAASRDPIWGSRFLTGVRVRLHVYRRRALDGRAAGVRLRLRKLDRPAVCSRGPGYRRRNG